MKKILFLVLLAVVSFSASSAIHAVSLKMKPLIYNETLKRGEKKKGFIDISNPLGKEITLMTSVQAFRQIDDNGSLEFYDNEQIQAGIIPDLTEFTLGPREEIRMYFLIDGTKLPEGDVFAALFVTTKGAQESRGISESVRLGTLMTLVNATPGAREASIESLTASFWQFGTGVHGLYGVKNTANPQTTTGFFPEVTVNLSPFTHESTVISPLVMAGKTRQGEFQLEGNRIGLYKLSVSYGASEQSRIVFVATGFWQWLLPVLIVVASAVLLVYHIRRRNRRSYYKAAPKPSE